MKNTVIFVGVLLLAAWIPNICTIADGQPYDTEAQTQCPTADDFIQSVRGAPRRIECVTLLIVNTNIGVYSSGRLANIAIALRYARGEVRDIVERINQLTDQLSAGHVPSQADIDALHWSGDVNSVAGGNDAQQSGIPFYQLNGSRIDADFLREAGAVLMTIQAAASREKAKAAAAKAEAAKAVADKKGREAEAALDNKARKLCGGKVLDYQSLGFASPFATKGRCYKVPMVVISQWVSDRVALANVSMIPFLIEFSSPPDAQMLFGNSIVRGEGAYQYQDTIGSLRTVPRVQMIAR